MACGLAPTQFVPLEKKGADYRFLILPPGKLAEITISDELRSHPNILDVDLTLQPGDEVRQLQTTSERAGFVVTKTIDRQSAVDVADWACRQISVSYDDGSVGHAYPLAEFQESPHDL
jgi:hypothetical protein